MPVTIDASPIAGNTRRCIVAPPVRMELSAFTPHPIEITIKPVRIGLQDGEASRADIPAVEVRWRRRDTRIGITRVTIACPQWLLALLRLRRHNALRCPGEFVRVAVVVRDAA